MMVRRFRTFTVRMVSNFINMQQINYVPNKRSFTWNIMKFIQPQAKTNLSYAVIILNRPLVQSEDFITKFWNKATIRVAVDGGTTHLDNFINNHSNNAANVKIPDLITGDFDSVKSDVLKKYESLGSKVIHTPDQDYTDFTKALIELNNYCVEKNIEVEHIIAVCQASGRIDHTLGNIQTLFLSHHNNLLRNNTSVYLLSDNALSWLLLPGEHRILVPEVVRLNEDAWCSLVPIGETCEKVTTRGLKWNLDNQPLSFGRIVSTSNTYSNQDEVTVQCSHTVLWSMSIPLVGKNVSSSI